MTAASLTALATLLVVLCSSGSQAQSMNCQTLSSDGSACVECAPNWFLSNGYCYAECDEFWQAQTTPIAECLPTTTVTRFQDGSFYSRDFELGERANDISLSFRTTEKYGLLFYSGPEVGTNDFIAIGLRRGHVVVSFIFDDDEFVIDSANFFPMGVSDGFWHSVRFLRVSNSITVTVDGIPSTQTRPAFAMSLDAEGVVHIGGLENFVNNKCLTKYGDCSFNGCITEVSVDGQAMILDDSAGAAVGGLSPCGMIACPSTSTCRGERTCPDSPVDESTCKCGFVEINGETFASTGDNCEVPVGPCSSPFPEVPVEIPMHPPMPPSGELTEAHICSANCGECLSTGVCTRCFDGFSLFDNSCIATCPQGWESVTDSNGVQICQEAQFRFNNQCSRDCYMCDTTDCLICKNAKYLFQGVCIDSCPVGTTARGSGNFRNFCE